MAGVAYRRNLPHVFPPHTSIFITWRLNGSIPASVVAAAREKHRLNAGKRFVAVDQFMDTAPRGPRWLSDPRIAEQVCNEIELGGSQALCEYALFAYVVMSNHVHMFAMPHAPVTKIMKRIKGNTARFANQVLGRDSGIFWQQESYDHFCRNAREFDRICDYIRWNPVKAGLVERPEDWTWSSAHRRIAITVV
jgi:putative transposase